MWIVYGHHLVQNRLWLVFFLFSFGYSFHVRTCMTTISGDDEEIILANNNVYAQITKYRTQFVPFNKYKIIFYSSPSLWSHIWSISLWIRSLFTHQIKKIWNKKKKLQKMVSTQRSLNWWFGIILKVIQYRLKQSSIMELPEEILLQILKM